MLELTKVPSIKGPEPSFCVPDSLPLGGEAGRRGGGRRETGILPESLEAGDSRLSGRRKYSSFHKPISCVKGEEGSCQTNPTEVGREKWRKGERDNDSVSPGEKTALLNPLKIAQLTVFYACLLVN
jgi:hypothetical protein